MSKALFIHNAYNILGLDSSASTKEVTRRAKQIENLSKIDETPEYPSDITFGKNIRTLASVKKALQDLLSPTKHIHEYFFWFTTKDAKDEHAIKLLQVDPTQAIEIWKAKLTKNDSDFISLKNKAIAESILFSVNNQTKYLNASIKSWKKLLSSDRAWQQFTKLYTLQSDAPPSDISLRTFRTNIEKILSEFYSSISKDQNDKSIYATFTKSFTSHGEHFNNNILGPLLDDINNITIQLNKERTDWNNSSNTEVPASTRESLALLIKKANQKADGIIELGDTIWANSKVVVVRDKIAMTFRNISLDITNRIDLIENITDRDLSGSLLDIAYSIAGTKSLESKLSSDIDAFNSLVHQIDTASHIKHLIKSGDFKEAIAYINTALAAETDPLIIDQLQKLKTHCAHGSHQYAQKSSGQSGVGGIIFIIFLIIISIILIANASS